MLSLPHLVVLFVIALVIFGPQKLPELARMLGKATAEFRKMTNDFRYALEDEVRELDRHNRIREEQAAAAARAAAEAAKAPVPAASPTPELAAPPEGAVARSIPETTVTATIEPPADEIPQETNSILDVNSGSSHTEAEAVSVPHEKPADDHAA